MTTITVKFASISREEYQQVIEYYNGIKPIQYTVLEELDRCEGGFQLALGESADTMCDINFRIKQLRWNRRRLDPLNFIGFNREETKLLYLSLIHVFGESEVVLQ